MTRRGFSGSTAQELEAVAAGFDPAPPVPELTPAEPEPAPSAA